MEFEKDFVMRQAKSLAKSLSGFLTQDSVDKILEIDKQDVQRINLNSFINKEIKKFEGDITSIRE